jgi:hypothetical protein
MGFGEIVMKAKVGIVQEGVCALANCIVIGVADIISNSIKIVTQIFLFL